MEMDEMEMNIMKPFLDLSIMDILTIWEMGIPNSPK